MYILLLFLVLIIVYKNIEYFRYKRIHPYDFPLLKEVNEYINTHECKNITEKMMNHPAFGLGGFCVRFSDSPETEKMFHKNNLHEIYDIFKRVKKHNTNVYVCNILVLPVSSGITIGEHYDGTHEKTDIFGRQYMPLCSTVLYLNLPNTFTGGRLFIKKFNSNHIYKKIDPAIGKLVEFRGDMSHGVDEIYSDEKIDRLSLVFEQYILDEEIPFNIESIFTETAYDETGNIIFM
jgi:hypothetical protein